MIDRTIADWLDLHPDGLVISLGEGLETQARRVDNGRMRWLSVDLPEPIRLREAFLPPTERFRHLAMSALDAEWMAMVDPSRPLFIVVQGLFMYLEPDAVCGLLYLLIGRSPAELDSNPPSQQVPWRNFNHVPYHRAS
jgi:O-methyltransferase involved in polyketide biosynthesis